MLKISRLLLRVPLIVRYKGRQFCSTTDEEVERKFVVTPEIENNLNKLVLLKPKERTFTDEYFDIEKTFDLSTRDLWLRRRDQIWELKWPMKKTNSSGLAGIDFYNESRDIKTISEVILSFTNHSALRAHESSFDFTKWVGSGLLRSFAKITTARTTYTIELSSKVSDSLLVPTTHKFNADIDRCYFSQDDGSTVSGDVGAYRIGEIELIRAGGMSQSQALEDIFSQLSISHTAVRGKVLEYLSRHKPLHFAALDESGLLASKLGDSTARRSEPIAKGTDTVTVNAGAANKVHSSQV